jgi:hypothetical protein
VEIPKQRIGRSRFAVVALLCAAALFAQQVLDDEAVIKLVRAGVSESIVLAIVKTQPGHYSLAAGDVIRLKNEGVPDPILAAMIEKQAGTPEPPLSSAAHPSWNDTPIPQWSEADAKQLLTDSPWTRNVRLDIVRNLSAFERRDGGDLEAGIPTGYGLATAGWLADWREIEAVEYAHQKAGLGTVTVRWESALPVRAAAMKVGETFVPGWVGDYYAIAVHDVQLPFRWNIENQLKGVAWLKRDMRKELKPFRVVVLPEADRLATILYLFPRSIEINREDGNLGFTAQIGRLFVYVNFMPEDMRIQGNLQL